MGLIPGVVKNGPLIKSPATLPGSTQMLVLSSTGVMSTQDFGSIGGTVGTTDNRIPRADGTGGSTLQASTATIDDSGNVTLTGGIFAATDGSADIGGNGTNRFREGNFSGKVRSGNSSLNDCAFEASPGFGVGYYVNNLLFLANGTLAAVITDSAGSIYSYRIPSNYMFAWDAGVGNISGPDTGFARVSPGYLELNTGTRGSLGDLRLRTLLKGAFTVATLPSASANDGFEARVTDSSVTTFRSVVAGGGSNKVKVFSNGTDWLVC